jgi:hypothetical protein
MLAAGENSALVRIQDLQIISRFWTLAPRYESRCASHDQVFATCQGEVPARPFAAVEEAVQRSRLLFGAALFGTDHDDHRARVVRR